MNKINTNTPNLSCRIVAMKNSWIYWQTSTLLGKLTIACSFELRYKWPQIKKMTFQDKENPSAPQIPVNNRFSFSKIPTFRKYSNNKKLEGNFAVSQTAKNSLKQVNLRGESGHQVWYFNVIEKRRKTFAFDSQISGFLCRRIQKWVLEPLSDITFVAALVNKSLIKNSILFKTRGVPSRQKHISRR